MKSFAIFLLAALFEVVVGCPNGFVQHDQSCYKIFHIRGSWSEAKSHMWPVLTKETLSRCDQNVLEDENSGALSLSGYCRVFGAELVSIETDRENHFLTGILGRDTAAAFTPGRFWLDATDLLSEGEWVWSASGEAIGTDSYSQWAPGQPSNTNNVENCLALAFSSNLTWDDDDCEAKNNFICEVSNFEGGAVIG